MAKSLILYMKDEDAVNADFQRNGKLPTLERVIEATQGNVVLSVVPGRLPGVNHNRPIQVKLLPEAVDYVRMLVEHYRLNLGQLGVYHCCDKGYQPGKDRHSHEEFLRHGTNGEAFESELRDKKSAIQTAFGTNPMAFTSPQNWMFDEKGRLNIQALEYISRQFDILVLPHPGRVLGIPFYKLKESGRITTGMRPSTNSSIIEFQHLCILPTADLTKGDRKTIEQHAGLYVHYDDLLRQGEKHVRTIEAIGSQIVSPSQLHYPRDSGTVYDKMYLSKLSEDVSRTALLRGFKELIR